MQNYCFGGKFKSKQEIQKQASLATVFMNGWCSVPSQIQNGYPPTGYWLAFLSNTWTLLVAPKKSTWRCNSRTFFLFAETKNSPRWHYKSAQETWSWNWFPKGSHHIQHEMVWRRQIVHWANPGWMQQVWLCGNMQNVKICLILLTSSERTSWRHYLINRTNFMILHGNHCTESSGKTSVWATASNHMLWKLFREKCDNWLWHAVRPIRKVWEFVRMEC